ncbi:hypothetical protein [Streptomyces sp. NPDC058657]|uniref:hypothetical protein n=1 Tax=unclassified Streptomyces TaxID=2593676 RepID=UPI00365513E6
MALFEPEDVLPRVREDRPPGHTQSMSGAHARPTSVLFPSAPAAAHGAPLRGARLRGARHGRREGLGRRLRRRILTYRDIEFRSARIPSAPGPSPSPSPSPSQECLLLVHVRKVVGQIHYRLCTTCEEGVITGVAIDEHFLASGLSTRALSHLRSRHPGITWRSTLTLRTTRDLLRRMRIPTAPVGAACVHARAVPVRPRPAG